MKVTYTKLIRNKNRQNKQNKIHEIKGNLN